MWWNSGRYTIRESSVNAVRFIDLIETEFSNVEIMNLLNKLCTHLTYYAQMHTLTFQSHMHKLTVHFTFQSSHWTNLENGKPEATVSDLVMSLL